MKRVFAVTLIIAFVMLTVVGCSSTSQTSTSSTQTSGTTTVAATNETSSSATSSTQSAAGSTINSSTGLKVSPSGKLKVAYLLDGLFNDSSQRHWQQVQNEVEVRGWDLISDTNVSGNYQADPTRQAFQNMMSQNPDAIVFSYLDVPPIADLIVQAHKQGIGVYCIGTDLSEGIMMNVSSNNSVIGAKVMAYVMDRLHGEANAMGFQNLWMTRGIRRDEIAYSIAKSKTYNVKNVESHDVTQEGFTDEMYSVTENWLTKYGSDLDFVWACWDGGGIVCAQAMAAAGYKADDMFTVGMDGGNQAWAYIRKGEIPFVASLAEPFEYQVHQCFEGIDQLQVQGRKPGDPDCIVPASGEYSTDAMTVMVDKRNVPPVGANIHSVFNYYGGDPNDKNAWYNKGKIYTVSDYTEKK